MKAGKYQMELSQHHHQRISTSNRRVGAVAPGQLQCSKLDHGGVGMQHLWRVESDFVYLEFAVDWRTESTPI